MMNIWTSDKNAEGLKAEFFVKLYSFPGSWDWPEASRKNEDVATRIQIQCFLRGLKWVSKNKVIAVGETLDSKSF